MGILWPHYKTMKIKIISRSLDDILWSNVMNLVTLWELFLIPAVDTVASVTVDMDLSWTSVLTWAMSQYIVQTLVQINIAEYINLAWLLSLNFLTGFSSNHNNDI